MFHIILYQPEIPPNTGNVIRLCANTGAQLHLVRPLGFNLDDRQLRRAGLDYHEFANVRVHDSLDACVRALFQFQFESEARRQQASDEDSTNSTAITSDLVSVVCSPNRVASSSIRSEHGSQHRITDKMELELSDVRLFAFTTKGSHPYHEVQYQAGDAFLFGPESRGLPAEVLESLTPQQRLRLPMLPHSRSLNLSNTVAIALFEAWRQCGFEGGVKLK